MEEGELGVCVCVHVRAFVCVCVCVYMEEEGSWRGDLQPPSMSSWNDHYKNTKHAHSIMYNL